MSNFELQSEQNDIPLISDFIAICLSYSCIKNLIYSLKIIMTDWKKIGNYAK